jgi:hypothetical protein
VCEYIGDWIYDKHHVHGRLDRRLSAGAVCCQALTLSVLSVTATSIGKSTLQFLVKSERLGTKDIIASLRAKKSSHVAKRCFASRSEWLTLSVRSCV